MAQKSCWAVAVANNLQVTHFELGNFNYKTMGSFLICDLWSIFYMGGYFHTILKNKIVGFSGIPTRIVRNGGEYDDHHDICETFD